MNKKDITILVCLFLVFCFTIAQIIFYYGQFPYEEVKKVEGNLTLRVGEAVDVKLPPLKEGDRVMVNLQTTALIGLDVVQDGKHLRVVPCTVEGLNYSFASYLLTHQKFFFKAEKNSNASYVRFYVLTPQTPYHLIFPYEGNGEIFISPLKVKGKDDKMINFTLVNQDKMFFSVVLAYPFEERVRENFKVKGLILHNLSGDSKIYFVVFSKTDNMLYEYDIKKGVFEINVFLDDRLKRGTILNDKVSMIGFLIKISPHNKTGNVYLGNLKIQNYNKEISIKPNVDFTFNAKYEIFIAHKHIFKFEDLILWGLLSVEIVVILKLFTKQIFSKHQIVT